MNLDAKTNLFGSTEASPRVEEDEGGSCTHDIFLGLLYNYKA